MKLLCDDALNIKLQYRMMKFFICSTLLYGAEVCTLRGTTIERLEALELNTSIQN